MRLNYDGLIVVEGRCIKCGQLIDRPRVEWQPGDDMCEVCGRVLFSEAKDRGDFVVALSEPVPVAWWHTAGVAVLTLVWTAVVVLSIFSALYHPQDVRVGN